MKKEKIELLPKEFLPVHIGIGYGGRTKITAEIDGQIFVIEKEQAEVVLSLCLSLHGYEVYQSKRMKYPRLTFKIKI